MFNTHCNIDSDQEEEIAEKFANKNYSSAKAWLKYDAGTSIASRALSDAGIDLISLPELHHQLALASIVQPIRLSKNLI